MSPRAQWSPYLIGVLILACSVRLVYILHFPAEALLADVDARGYQQIAVNLLQGHGFSMSSEPPYLADTIRTPAYPLFMAALYAVFGPHPRAVVIAQGLLDAALCLVLWSLTCRLTRSKKAALAASLLYALNPTAWHYTNALLTETLLALVIACLAWALVPQPDAPAGEPGITRSVLLGLLCGLAMLIKPNLLLLPVIVVSCLMLYSEGPSRTRIKRSAVVLLPAFLVISPWLVRNGIVAGRPILSSAFDDNLCHVSAVATLAHAQHEVVAPWSPRWEAIYETILAIAVRRYQWPSTPVHSAREAYERQRQLAAVAREVIRQHPADFALSHLNGFLRSWVPQEHREWYENLSGRPWDSLHITEGVAGQALALLRAAGPGAAIRSIWQGRFVGLPPLAFALWAGFILAYVLSAILLAIGCRRLRHNPGFVLLFLLLLLYVTLLPGPISYDRFRVPALPLINVVMAIGLIKENP